MSSILLPHITKSTLSATNKNQTSLLTGSINNSTSKDLFSSNLAPIHSKNRTKILGNRNYSMVVDTLSAVGTIS